MDGARDRVNSTMDPISAVGKRHTKYGKGGFRRVRVSAGRVRGWKTGDGQALERRFRGKGGGATELCPQEFCRRASVGDDLGGRR